MALVPELAFTTHVNVVAKREQSSLVGSRNSL